MSLYLFITLFGGGSIFSGLLTQAIKTAYRNAGKEHSPNVTALIDAIVVGGLGSAAAYMLLGVPWTVNNVICIAIMIVLIWIGSMVGYDKVTQLFEQVSNLNVKEDEKNSEG